MSDTASRKGKPIDIDDPFARRLVGKYLENRKDDIEKLKRAVKKSDLETVRITGHNLYGSGAAYGLDEVSWIGASLESAAEAADIPRIERLIGELTEFLARLGVF